MANMIMVASRVPVELKDRIEAAAAKERRKPSDWIRCRLEDVFAQEREKPQSSEAA